MKLLPQLPHRPQITPYLLGSLAKSYFQLHKNKPLHQEKFLFKHINASMYTQFGQTHNFEEIASIEAFQRNVPVMHYDTLWPWIEQSMRGEANILVPGYIEWFATSSGTTGSQKYIPVTKVALKSNHFKAGTTGLMHYIKENPKSTVFSGQNITIGGGFTQNPYTKQKNVGYISAILQKNSPIRAKMMKQPKAKVSYLLDRDTKVEKMISITSKKNITSIAGQPSRCSQFLTKVLEKTGKKNILEVWPHFQLVMRGGMSIELYKETFAALLPTTHMQYYQIYNASEGFFAMQHENGRDDMLLFLNHGVFYEFIPLKNYIAGDYKTALTIHEVEIDQEYVILVTTNSGLWRYVLGDTIIFTGLAPHTIKITGRTKYYIDIAGECTPLKPLEEALFATASYFHSSIKDYTVGPSITQPTTQLRGYEIAIEWENIGNCDPTSFSHKFDELLSQKWSYYYDERYDTKMLQEPIIHFVAPGTFYTWLEKNGKLGGQHKIPKVSNNRDILTTLLS